ncbi:MAG: hypothetical protein ACJ8EH_01540 [Sphingomicrobium sp.]|jgi:hypothetical protein
MGFERKVVRMAVAAVLSLGAAPAVAGSEPLIVTKLADPADANYLPAASGLRSAGGSRYEDPVDQAVEDFSRAIGQAVVADKQAVQARCRTGPPANASTADRWAWAAGCHYARH